MKKIVAILISIVCVVGCKSAKIEIANILESKDINELKSYIESHPKDKDIAFLKQKLIALQVSQNPTKVVIPKPVVKSITEQEADEFIKLMELDKAQHATKTVNMLNQMFNTDVSSKDALIIVTNNSDCNLILRIQGKSFFNLAVPAKGENSVVIPYDTYVFSGHLCDATYTSTKIIKKNLSVVLGTKTVQNIGASH